MNMVKNMIKNVIGLAAVSAVFAVAGESFYGVGISFKAAEEGVRVVDIIPGTSADSSRLLPGDVILSINDVSLHGRDIVDAKELFRGQEGKPVVVEYLSGEDVLVDTLNRARMTVESIESFSDAETSDKKLLAVMSYGKVVNGEVADNSALKGIYVGGETQAIKIAAQPTMKFAKVSGFTRESIQVKLQNPGSVSIAVIAADGKVLYRTVLNHAKAGVNSVSWDGAKIPSGRYMVLVGYNGRVNGINVTLK